MKTALFAALLSVCATVPCPGQAQLSSSANVVAGASAERQEAEPFAGLPGRDAASGGDNIQSRRPSRLFFVNDREDPADEEFYPVDLKCPKGGDGVVALISRRKNGQAERLKLQYKSGKPIAVTIEAAENGGRFWKIFPEGNELSIEEKEEVRKTAIKKIDKINNEICLGSRESKERYGSLLAANAKRLKRRPR